MATPLSFQAFTVKANGTLNRIITDIAVRPAFDPASPPNPPPPRIATKALWDTGATKSVISHDPVKSLGLTPVGTTNVNHGGGSSRSPTYLVNFDLPHKVGVTGALVTEFPAPADGSFGAIVGMDVICLGDFAITNVSGRTWVSFRTPSCAAIDYVVEANKLTFAGVGRNDPCPCGSGKKYKKCHGI